MPNRGRKPATERRRRQARPNRRSLPGIPLRITGPGNSSLHRFTRIFDSIIITPTSDGGGAYDFRLSQAAGFAELTVLFDQYKIEGVEMTFTASQSSNSAFVWPRLFVCYDPDDSDVPANKNVLLERGNTKIHTFNPMRRSYKVNVLPVAVLDTDTSAGLRPAMQAPKGWIDCNQANVLHYGVKYWLEDFNSGLGSPFLKVMMRYHLAFRSSR